MSRFRTASGGRVDRARRLKFTFDGASFEGLQGDTLASALLAHGVHLVGRSFKSPRPRGLLPAGAEEPSALVTVRRDDARMTPKGTIDWGRIACAQDGIEPGILQRATPAFQPIGLAEFHIGGVLQISEELV